MPSEAFDLRLAAPFVVLAEELHFGRAAQRLGVKQPVLSQQLARLERQLGAQLVDRGGGRIALTPAGARFLVEVREMLARVDLARAAVRSGVGELRLNLGASNHRAVGDVVGSFVAAHPSIAVATVESSSTLAARAVRAGEADAGFAQPQDALPGQGYVAVASAPLGVLTAVDHPVAVRGHATWADLEGETLLVGPPGASDGWVQLLRATFDRMGVRVHEVAGLSSPKAGYHVHRIAHGGGVLVVPSWTLDPVPPEIAWTVLEPEQPIELGVVWDDRRAAEPVRRFVAWAQARSRPAVVEDACEA